MNEEAQTQSVTCVGPWLNKEEFEKVANAIYGQDANWQTKQYACDMLTIWKIRRQNMIPATIISTLTILKVQLKDHELINDIDPDKVTLLKNMYSNAFIRFLNFMSSIMQHKMVKTMYATATELGIEPFLVDLRHLCSHGHAVPSVEVFRRSADYCMKWLQSYYWDPALLSIQNVTVQDIRLTEHIDYETKVRELFLIYDAATEIQRLRIYRIDDITSGIIVQKSMDSLKSYAKSIKQVKLSAIAPYALNQLTDLTFNMGKNPEIVEIYCDHLFQCRYFLETSVKFALLSTNSNDCKETAYFISIHQNLFRSMAICGFVRHFFDFLMKICENSNELYERRYAANFWAKQIITGYQTFKSFKRIYKQKKDKRANYHVDMALLNTEEMSSEIREIYTKNLGLNCGNLLIFGDSIRRPWTLTLDREYFTERLINVNEFTCDIMTKCMELVHPQLNEKSKNELLNFMEIALSNTVEINESIFPYDSIKYFTVDDINNSSNFPKEKKIDENKMDVDEVHTDKSVKTFGIWSTVPENINWSSIPIGCRLDLKKYTN